MMTNHPSSEDLFAYRDGELDFDKRGLVEAHVLSCTACSARLEAASDAEGFLRQLHAEPPEGYLEEMTESVMTRVAGGTPVRSAAGAAGAGSAAGGAARSGEPGAAPRTARASRRHQFDEVERGRAPRLPWPAIVSAVSAAAAVVVVVALLFKNQGTGPLALRKSVPAADEKEKQATEPVRTDEAPAGDAAKNALPETAGQKAATGGAMNDKDAGSLAGNAPVAGAPVPPATTADGRFAAPEREKAENLRASRTAPGERDEAAITSQNADDVVPPAALEKKDGAASNLARAREQQAGQVRPMAGMPDAAASTALGSAGSDFRPLLARYGLPPVYDPSRVSNETLLRAESDIRTLYQTGRAGDDSARVRLYLAEAARLRAGDSPDEETYDAIVHHYRRAYQLAHDPETARMAKKRLDDFVSRIAPTTP